MKILLVEDEVDVKDLMTLHLKREGHDVTSVTNGEEALKLLQSQQYDLAVLDWMLPGVSGLELCKSVGGKIPVLMVTARSSSTDIVVALEAGADDYITKPFEIPVFIARVRALLRRGHAQKSTSGTSQNILKIGALTLYQDEYKVLCAESPVELTRSEFKLLAAMMSYAGKVLPRDRLIKLVQGEGVTVTDRVIDTHIFGVRKKLGPCADIIESIRGVGYRVKTE